MLLGTACGGAVGAQADAGGEAGGGGIDAGGVDGVDASRGHDGGRPGADAGGTTMPDSGADGAGADGGDDAALGDGATGSDGGGCPATQPMGGTWLDEGPCDTNGLVCRYTSTNFLCQCLRNDCAGGSGGCCPKTCEQLGFPCGVAGDGCGGLLHCRVCPAGQSCNANSPPYGACVSSDDAGATQDGGVCVPTGCPQPACGVIDDGCGGTIDCGDCAWNCQPDMM